MSLISLNQGYRNLETKNIYYDQLMKQKQLTNLIVSHNFENRKEIHDAILLETESLRVGQNVMHNNQIYKVYSAEKSHLQKKMIKIDEMARKYRLDHGL